MSRVAVENGTGVRAEPMGAARRPRCSMSDAIASLIAIVIALIFFFPLYWAISTGLRRPAETFTVAGVGIPFIDFTPTLENWVSQLSVPEAYHAFGNSIVISSVSVLMALALGLPAAYALARFRFDGFFKNKDLTVWFLSSGVWPQCAAGVACFLVFFAA